MMELTHMPELAEDPDARAQPQPEPVPETCLIELHPVLTRAFTAVVVVSIFVAVVLAL